MLKFRLLLGIRRRPRCSLQGSLRRSQPSSRLHGYWGRETPPQTSLLRSLGTSFRSILAPQYLVNPASEGPDRVGHRGRTFIVDGELGAVVVEGRERAAVDGTRSLGVYRPTV